MAAPLWCVLGDFNAILGSYESTGITYSTSCFEFTGFLAASSLVDLDTKGAFYTRVGKGARGLVLSCLDRALCSTGFVDLWSSLSDLWSSLSCNTLPQLHSDHYPLLLLGRDSRFSRPRPFRFLNVWVEDPTFLDLVSGSWSSLVSGCPTFRLFKKLKLLRTSLRTWNWEVFRDLSSKVNRATDMVTEIQIRLQANSFSEKLFREEADALLPLIMH
ncbi:Endonuclease/exonuclease/phosphatase [Trema orientale]|uniref:Endonuclease/exonuclease/phosphatase n=1 Tax=Trema orientale TaxID=63057 RepID=A0A2P5BJM4_TREOI|nr:Endonuclease/exonuclease/phosphatase [Trema orientale]